jgi:hypothetical protein
MHASRLLRREDGGQSTAWRGSPLRYHWEIVGPNPL